VIAIAIAGNLHCCCRYGNAFGVCKELAYSSLVGKRRTCTAVTGSVIVVAFVVTDAASEGSHGQFVVLRRFVDDLSLLVAVVIVIRGRVELRFIGIGIRIGFTTLLIGTGTDDLAGCWFALATALESSNVIQKSLTDLLYQ